VHYVKYSIKTSSGGFVELEEKNSILITIGMVIMGLISISLLALGVLVYGETPGLTVSLIGGSLLTGIYTAILSHLKHKADMDPSEASIQSVTGGSIRVWKESSVWISILLGFIYIGLITSFIALGYGLFIYNQAPVAAERLVYIGLTGLVSGGVLAKILGFLRTRLNFKGERIIAPDINGNSVELYKDHSIWLTLGFLATVLAGLVLIAIPALQTFGIISLNYGDLMNNNWEAGSTGHVLESVSSYTGPVTMFITGLILLVNAAVLNFLSVKVQVRKLNS
jgi:hypothetical protein